MLPAGALHPVSAFVSVLVLVSARIVFCCVVTIVVVVVLAFALLSTAGLPIRAPIRM